MKKNLEEFSGRFYRAVHLKEHFGVSSQRLASMAKDNGWEKPHPGIYNANDVDAYIKARTRRKLAGTKFLVRHDKWDTECPVCRGFAIFRPPTQKDWDDFGDRVYGDDWPVRCDTDGCQNSKERKNES